MSDSKNINLFNDTWEWSKNLYTLPAFWVKSIVEFGRQVVTKRDCQIARLCSRGDVLGTLALCICRDDRGVLAAEMDVSRSVTKRVTFLYHTLYSSSIYFFLIVTIRSLVWSIILYA